MARALVLCGAVLLTAGCAAGQTGEQAEQAAGSSTGSTETTSVPAASPTTAQNSLTSVDPGSFASPHNPGVYAWNYSTGGSHVGLCVSGRDAVTCTGKAGPSIPDLIEHFPGRPGAIELGAAGLRYSFVEGVPPVSARLGNGQEVEIGELRCAKPNADTLECRSADNSFTIRGPGQAITTSGTVLAERDVADHPGADSADGSSSADSPGTSVPQPREYLGATGLVSGVRTSSRPLVTASTPPCDGRGILILDSFVENPRPQQGIAAILDRHPGAEFATPGQCPSLRGDVNGARVYPIYIDHGHDTAALCRDKTTRGGNARLLTASAEYTDPC
ncbi:hypothetical protein [Rhodococcus sp. IEGM 1408]|uniref:hypothetical protein n=1 Tax=Rhodococcus sp. IEGM 1408 TaxID=3082220 RepID=UPI00295567B7|nr:hypothetical protein [Rhodococcus sp. IEGM 1408]MDV8002590.1 hypothetical protein [Rhodococcus sp. IEGM 1408]